LIVQLYNHYFKEPLNQSEEIYLINNLDENIEERHNIIPLIKNFYSLELDCLNSTYFYFEKKGDLDKHITFKIESRSKIPTDLNFFCINSFKKRKFLYKNISLKIDPENFNIKISNIPELISFFTFFKKTKLINCEEYFFSFLLNFYFYFVDKK